MSIKCKNCGHELESRGGLNLHKFDGDFLDCHVENLSGNKGSGKLVRCNCTNPESEAKQ